MFALAKESAVLRGQCLLKFVLLKKLSVMAPSESPGSGDQADRGNYLRDLSSEIETKANYMHLQKLAFVVGYLLFDRVVDMAKYLCAYNLYGDETSHRGWKLLQRRRKPAKGGTFLSMNILQIRIAGCKSESVAILLARRISRAGKRGEEESLFLASRARTRTLAHTRVCVCLCVCVCAGARP